MEKFLVYGDGFSRLPMKQEYKDSPLPEDLNKEIEEIAEKFNYPKLLEIVKTAKKLKRFGAAHFFLNGIEVAKFDFWFGICMRVVYALGDIGDNYKEVQDKLKQAHGSLIPIAIFKKSYVPESISTHRPHERGVDKRSAEYKDKWLKGEE